MIKVSVEFDANINFKWLYYRPLIIVSFEDGDGRVYLRPDPEKTAYLVNKYGRILSVQPFGYTVELPENAVLALKYLSYVEGASLEELEEIVETGETEIQRFMKKLGFASENRKIEDLFSEVKLCEDASFSLSLKDFPTVELHFKDCVSFIRFNAKEVNPEFLGRVLRDKISEDEHEMLRGILLLSDKAQRKYMRLLSNGELTRERLVKALFRAASASRDKVVWKGIADWFRRNGCENYASQIIVKKTLM